MGVVRARVHRRPDAEPCSHHDRIEILAALETHRAEFSDRFAAHHLGLFGSAARDELRADSDIHIDIDIDIRVEFDGQATFDGCFEPNDFLELALGSGRTSSPTRA